MNNTLLLLSQKKKQLDAHKPLLRELEQNLDQWFKVELTYTSNAIEGNTLSRAETNLVLEKGLVVEGKTLVEHLEAVNHSEAVEYIKSLTNLKRTQINQSHILKIHELILSKIDDSNAGCYRSTSVRIAGSMVVMPNSTKVPELMEQFLAWLHSNLDKHPVVVAAMAHHKLVSIHPFVDGNGRTARLLANLILLQDGYPLTVIKVTDRKRYINSIEQAQLGGTLDDFISLVCEAVNNSLDIYLESLSNDEPCLKDVVVDNNDLDGNERLLKIGEIAKLTEEQVHTIRYWTGLGLLQVADQTKGGYQLFHPKMINRAKLIRRLQQEERLTLNEIGERLGSE